MSGEQALLWGLGENTRWCCCLLQLLSMHKAAVLLPGALLATFFFLYLHPQENKHPQLKIFFFTMRISHIQIFLFCGCLLEHLRDGQWQEQLLFLLLLAWTEFYCCIVAVFIMQGYVWTIMELYLSSRLSHLEVFVLFINCWCVHVEFWKVSLPPGQMTFNVPSSPNHPMSPCRWAWRHHGAV